MQRHRAVVRAEDIVVDDDILNGWHQLWRNQEIIQPPADVAEAGVR